MTTPTAQMTTDDRSTELRRGRALWQRIGGWTMVIGGGTLVLKAVLLFVLHPDPLPRFLIAPGESLLITVGLLSMYTGATALVVPVLGRRPAWLLALLAPFAVLFAILTGHVFGALARAVVGSAENPVVRNETGILLWGLAACAVGLWLARRGRS